MIITSIIPVDKRRSKVLFDEDFALVLYKGELRKYQMIEGSQITQEQYREIMETILYKRARERALYILKNSDKTEQDLRISLKRSGYPEEAIQYAMDFLKKYQYIDDENYGRRYIEFYSNKKSKRQMEFDLQQKGLSRELVSLLMEECSIDEEKQIENFLQKKHYNTELATPQERSKLSAALGRKGFSFEKIRKIMEY